jgi:hypothetical protein
MKSTCEDVKRILPNATCKTSYETFDLGDEKVRIRFSEHHCYEAYQKYWDVPVGTVVIIERYMKKPLPLTDFHVDVSKCGKVFTDFEGEVIYSCNGISFYTQSGGVNIIYYMPTAEDNQLECTKKGRKVKGPKRG